MEETVERFTIDAIDTREAFKKAREEVGILKYRLRGNEEALDWLKRTTLTLESVTQDLYEYTVGSSDRLEFHFTIKAR